MRKVAVLARIFDEYRESHENLFHGRIKYLNYLRQDIRGRQKCRKTIKKFFREPSEEIHSNERDCNAMQSDLKRK